MPADLQYWHPTYLADAKGKLLYRHVNTVSTPVSTSSWLADGRAIADVYELVFTKSGAVTCTVDAKIAGTKNPYRNMTGVSVTADGATVNKNIVPGVGLVISASVDTGWTARVSVMNYLADDGSYTAFFGYGVVQAGSASTGQRVAVKNVGAADAMSTVVYMLPGLHWSGASSELIIARIAPHSSTSRHRLAVAGSYAVTFADWKTGGSGKKTADIYVDGVKAVEDAEFDGTTVYEYGDGHGYVDGADKLAGLQIVLVDTVSDPSAVTATLTVASTDAHPWSQFATDVSGSPGAYSYQDLTLTESGQPAGTIRAGQAAYFWHKWVLPTAATAGNLREMIPRLRGLTV